MTEPALLFPDLSPSPLEPAPETWSEWVALAQAYATDFLSRMESGPAYRQPSVDAGYHPAEFSIGETGTSLPDILEELKASVDHWGLNPASGGHLAYIPGGGVLPSALGDFLAAVTNRYAGVAFANPGAVDLEHFLIRWMAGVFQFPKTTGGTLTSGGSIANLVAIVSAREARNLRPSVYEQQVIYGASSMHHCLHKALRISGLGHSVLRQVPMDPFYRMRPDALEALIREDRRQGLHPFMIIASAGTTDTGSIDPLDELADIARKEDLWFHVDAAYGGFFVMVPELRDRFRGLSRADSLVVDPHKGLFLPYGTGAVLVRDIRHLHAAHAYEANYMQDANVEAVHLSPADLSPELTRHFRGLRLYLALKVFGRGAFVRVLAEKRALCLLFHQEVARLGYETGPEPDLSVTRFRWGTGQGANQTNLDIVRAIHQDGRVFLSSTTLNGEVWIRMAILSFRTHEHHIRLALDLLDELARKIQENG